MGYFSGVITGEAHSGTEDSYERACIERGGTGSGVKQDDEVEERRKCNTRARRGKHDLSGHSGPLRNYKR
jgi:hypothetical protein